MSAPLRAVPAGTRPVDELATMLRGQLPDPAADGDPSETGVVRFFAERGYATAERYVVMRLLHTLNRLDDPMTRALAWTDGPRALAAYETLRELGGVS